MLWVMAKSWPGGWEGSQTSRYRCRSSAFSPGESRRSTWACAASAGHRSAWGGLWSACSRWRSRPRWDSSPRHFPTAGGLYHWAAILGGRGWGWTTAWFNLAGLITVLAAINVGTYRFAVGGLVPVALPPHLDLMAQALGVGLITFSQAAINHLGIGVTARLTDFSGYWILVVAAVLAACLLAFAPGLDPSRLVTFENFSGTAGGDVWPATEGLALLFALGMLLPAYTITGFDASAHAAEETKSAAENVPRGIVRSVLVSGVAGWVLLCVVVMAAPRSASSGRARRRGIPFDHERSASSTAGCRTGRRDRRGPVPLRAGHRDLCLADGVCLRTRRRASLLTCAALGLPQ